MFTAPILPDAKMHLVRPTEPVVGRVVSTELCMNGKSASFVRHVGIDVSGTPLEGNFLVGQSFGVVMPGVDHNGRPHKVRLYSIASPSHGEDGAGKVLSTTLKRLLREFQPQSPKDDPDRHDLFVGVCSNYLCDQRVGAELHVSGPVGRSFLLPVERESHDYVFVATSTGIAPFRGMVMELFDGPDGPTTSQIHLVMGAPYSTDLLFDGLFREYASRFGNFHYHTAISREPRAPDSGGIYVHGLIDEMMDSTFGPVLQNPRTLTYVCGLAGMQIGLFKVLAARGFTDYLRIRNDDVAATPANEWTHEQIRRFVRPSKRCMLEVY